MSARFRRLAGLLCLTAIAGAVQAAEVSDLRVEPASFDPTRDQKVALRFKLSAADRVSVTVHDPDGGRVATVAQGLAGVAGENVVEWNGRDAGGRVVPDEAYSFVVETASGGVYDPLAGSGGAVGDVTEAELDREGGTLSYRLPSASRVLVRLGIESGPMHRTLVDWKPRAAGQVTEYWDGWDESRQVRFRDAPGFTILITYVTLPEATVIAFGNRERTYRDHKIEEGKALRSSSRLEEREAFLGQLVPPAWARAPQVLLSFTGTGREIPEVHRAVDLRVDVAEEDRDYLLGEQFEIIFYLDNVFFAEAERGYLPFNWTLELEQLPPGEHLVTVNVSSFTGQVGVASRKVRLAGSG